MEKRNQICMIYSARRPNTWHGFPSLKSAMDEAERHCKRHIFSYGTYMIFVDGVLIRFGFPSDGPGVVFWVMAV